MTRSSSRAVARVVVACAAIVACKSSKTNPPTPIAPEPSTSAQPDAAPKPEDVVDFGEPGPLVVAPAVPPFDQKLPMDHAHTRGWSADGSTLGACNTSPVATFCTLLARDGALSSLDDDAGNSGMIDPKKHASLEAKLKALDLKPESTARWRYARDVEVTWTVLASTGSGTSTTPGILRIGARVHGGPPSWIDSIVQTGTAGPYYEIHPEAIALSPDGKLLGVVAHAFGGEFNNHFPLRTYDVSTMAAHAYNDAGFARHQKEDWAGSVDFFHKATAADPTFGLGHYNLACAYARIGDARAEQELKRAIDLGDASEVKARAASDADFTSVKTQAWFVALTK